VSRSCHGEANRNAEWKKRLYAEIIVDAYGPEEQAMGWYYYLDDKLRFPFRAECITKRPVSRLRVGQTVEVTGMALEEECEHEMFVLIDWHGEGLAVPLAQLKPIGADAKTEEAVADWHY